MTSIETQAQFNARMAVGYADRDTRWATSRAAELAVDILMLRDAELRQRADDLDADFDGDDAGKTVTAVDAEWGDLDEDAAVADPARFGRYLDALNAALDQVAEDYREAPRRPSRSGWESEAFPKADLGLY